MPNLEFIQQSGALGYALLFGPGIVLLLIALAVKGAVKTTHNFVISGRLLGFGFGVASLISVWTWSMAVMLSSAQAYTWGTSGLVWFIVPNGLAVIIMVPFALKLRQKMPAGYTLAEFIRARFQNSISSVATLVFLIGALLGVIMINLAGLVLVMNKIFGLTPISIVITGIIVVTVYSYFGGLTTSAVTGTLNTLLLGVGSSVVVLYALAKAGGAELVFNEVKALGDQHLNPFNPVTAASFGLALALGLLTNVIADQSFWQRVWAIRPKDLGRSFLWAGVWFYPIPLALGLLGFIGVAYGVTPERAGLAGCRCDRSARHRQPRPADIHHRALHPRGRQRVLRGHRRRAVRCDLAGGRRHRPSLLAPGVRAQAAHHHQDQHDRRGGNRRRRGADRYRLRESRYHRVLLRDEPAHSGHPEHLLVAHDRDGIRRGCASQESLSVGRCARRSGPTYGPLFGIIGLIAASAVVSIVVSLRANTRFDFDSLAEGKAALLERENAAAPTDKR